MRELSLQILDLAQNSIEAGARSLQIAVNENENGYFTFSIADDGRGMTEEMVKKVRDPFVTTRLTRKVGMGIPFMDMVTAQCGGYFDIKSAPGEGTTVKAAFKADNIDRPPLGDIAGSIAVLLAGAPGLNLIFTYAASGGCFVFNTDEVREVLGREADFAHPEIYRWTEGYLRQQIKELHAGQEE